MRNTLGTTHKIKGFSALPLKSCVRTTCLQVSGHKMPLQKLSRLFLTSSRLITSMSRFPSTTACSKTGPVRRS